MKKYEVLYLFNELNGKDNNVGLLKHEVKANVKYWLNKLDKFVREEIKLIAEVEQEILERVNSQEEKSKDTSELEEFYKTEVIIPNIKFNLDSLNFNTSGNYPIFFEYFIDE